MYHQRTLFFIVFTSGIRLKYFTSVSRCLFASIHDVRLEETRSGPTDPTDEIGFMTGGRSVTPGSRAKTGSALSNPTRGETPPKIDKRLTQIYVSTASTYRFGKSFYDSSRFCKS